MSETKYPHVFAPIRIGPVEVANRFFIPPHGIGLLAAGAHGSLVPSDDFAYYYAERAAAGVGLLIHSLFVWPRHPFASPYFEENVPSFRAVSELVHDGGAKLFAELCYMWGHNVSWDPMSPMIPSFGPSPHQNYVRHDTIHEMDLSEIRLIVESYERAGRHLRAAGYDGVELHASHGTVAEQFLSPHFNRRTDAYGGDRTGRMRFIVECLRALRENVSPRMAVGIRFNCDELLPLGYDQAEARAVLTKLVDDGLIDFADLDISVEPQQSRFMAPPVFLEPMANMSYVASVGAAVRGRIPVIATGPRITNVAQAEKLIADGIVDMVGAVRELMAEPELIKNAREGNEERSRTCIAAMGCLSANAPRPGWGCVINPATGREKRWGTKTFGPATRRGKVVVAGAGPAGLEAARVAAMRGHKVVVLERGARIGGQLSLWAAIPGRRIVSSAVEWYAERLAELKVDLRLGAEATVESVLAEKPDAVIVATGARYVRDGESGFDPRPIPGWDRDFVHTPERILEGGARPAGNVLILDEEGMYTAVGIAEILAAQGARVEIVNRDFLSITPGLVASMEHAFVVPTLRRLGVRHTPGTYVREIGDRRVTVYDVLTQAEETREVDAVVLSTMRKADAALAKGLGGSVAQLYVIGDALSPRKLVEATYEGHRFARFVGEPFVPSTTSEALFTPTPAEWFPRPASAILAERRQPAAVLS